jgi:hypothetical protein
MGSRSGRPCGRFARSSLIRFAIWFPFSGVRSLLASLHYRGLCTRLVSEQYCRSKLRRIEPNGQVPFKVAVFRAFAHKSVQRRDSPDGLTVLQQSAIDEELDDFAQIEEKRFAHYGLPRIPRHPERRFNYLVPGAQNLWSTCLMVSGSRQTIWR